MNFQVVVAFRIYPMLVYDVTGDYTGLGETGESLLVQKGEKRSSFESPAS